MGKASNQEGVIACTGAFPPARWRPAHLVEWQQKRAYGLGGCPSWRSGLLRPRFCWGYLWLQVVIQKDQGSISRVQNCPCLERLLSSESVTSWDFSSPGCLCASLIPWPGSKITLEEYMPRARASGTIQESSLLNLLVEARLKGDPGNLSGVETRASTVMAEGGA